MGRIYNLVVAQAAALSTCAPAYQCSGVRNLAKDFESERQFELFTNGVGIGGRNELKSLVDVPTWNIISLTPGTSLNDIFGIKPFFRYETSRPGSESVGAFVGARAVDVAALWAGGKVAPGVSRFGSTAEPMIVIGRQPHTRALIGLENAEILNVPKSAWSMDVNNAWVQRAISQRRTVYMASPRTPQNINGTVFGTEIKQFRQAGYSQWGNFLVPPPQR